MEALGGERRYISYSFTTSGLDGGEWSETRPGRALALGKGPPVPNGQEAGSQCRSGHKSLKEKSFRLCRGSNLDRPEVQPTAWHYTDWATRLTPGHNYMLQTDLNRCLRSDFGECKLPLLTITKQWSIRQLIQRKRGFCSFAMLLLPDCLQGISCDLWPMSN
jgi:hypothetical protein